MKFVRFGETSCAVLDAWWSCLHSLIRLLTSRAEATVYAVVKLAKVFLPVANVACIEVKFAFAPMAKLFGLHLPELVTIVGLVSIEVSVAQLIES